MQIFFRDFANFTNFFKGFCQFYERLDLSSVSHLALLTHLELNGNVSGDGSSLQNLTQLQHLDLSTTPK